jgi:putative membrane protein
LLLALAFILYFTDYILNAQSIGVNAIQTDEFRQIHSASELCIKILLVLQVVLFFIKFQTIKMAKSDEI